MILALGGDEAKNHRAIGGLAAVIRTKPEWSTEESFVELVDRGREIQREVVYTRYPLKVAGEWITPMKYYTPEKVRRIIDNAKFAVNIIKGYLKRLTLEV